MWGTIFSSQYVPENTNNILSWLIFKVQETIYIYIVNYRQLQYDELLENNTNSKYIRNMVQVTLNNIIY